jgi:2-hydroxy-3-oxopropionate reductase
MTKPIVGFIGLGIMGRPMAANIKNAGYELHVYARRAESMLPLEQLGVLAYASPELVAAKADIVFIMVSDTPDVEQVIFGDNGIAAAKRRGQIVVDMSTISPVNTREMARRLAEQGIDMLDAPVSGGEVGAVAGSLSIMVGGKSPVFEKVRPLFETMGRNIVHIGEHGAGQVAKACNQITVGGAIAAVAEAMLFAQKNGADPYKVREALLGGFAGSKILEVHGKRMLDHNFQPGFKTRLHQKDMDIVLDTARQIGLALPTSAMVAQFLNALVGSGDGELDSSAIVKVIEKMSQ